MRVRAFAVTIISDNTYGPRRVAAHTGTPIKEQLCRANDVL
jgi:hypothetical protein